MKKDKKGHYWIPLIIEKEEGLVIYECRNCKELCWAFAVFADWKKEVDKTSCEIWQNEE